MKNFALSLIAITSAALVYDTASTLASLTGPPDFSAMEVTQELANISQFLANDDSRSIVADIMPKILDGNSGLLRAAIAIGPNIEQAQAMTGPLSDALRTARDTDELIYLVRAVPTLRPNLTAEQTNSLIEVARTVLAAAESPEVAEACVRAIAVTLPLDPSQTGTYVAAMVELLKWPTTAEPGATEALLEVLHDRVPEAPGKEAGLDATVQWVATTFPAIDLDSPPRPPASGSTGGAW